MFTRKRKYSGAALTTLISCAAAVSLSSSAWSAEPFKKDAYQNYQANVKNGETLFNAGGCGSCHGTSDNPELLSGGLKITSYVGTFYAPNLTSSAKGIGSWTNANFLNAMLNGISPKGRHYYPVFPYTNYAGMKPEDVLDIKAYIGTLAKSDNTVPKHEVSFPYNLNSTMSFWKRRNFDATRWAPGKDDQLARGKYLVDNVGACGSCHTPRSTTYGTLKDKWMEGSKGITGGYAPAINGSVMAALASPDVFTKGVMVEGKKLNGQPIADPVMRAIVKQTAKLTEEDRLAMFAYLKGTEIKVEKPKLEVKTCTGGVSAAAAAPAAGQDPKLAADADEFIGKYCRNCHGLGQSSQGSFPAGPLNAIAADASFVTPGDPSGSRLYKSITSGRMPIGSKPSQAEVARLAEWITSLGATGSLPVAAPQAAAEPPRIRKVVKRTQFVRAALDDLGQVEELDREFIRYFSYRAHYNGRFPCEDEQQYAKRQKLYVAGFNKMLNSVSLGPKLVNPEVVEGTKELLVRVDIRDLGWDKLQWDVLISKYPYGLDPSSEPSLKTLTHETKTALPIMRADWFIAGSSTPATYHALLKLPKNIAELEKRLGINVDDNIKRGNVARAAFDRGASGVSAHNRMVERHDLPQGGYYWKSYDFAGSFGKQSLRERPHGPPEVAPLAHNLKSFEHDGGEMIFSLPNGLQGYYLSDHKGNRIDEGPEKIVSYQQRPKDKAPTIINGRSCVDCHADGILTKLDSMRKHIQTTNKFDVEQSKFLLSMYIEQAKMDEFYDRDKQAFVTALQKIGATQKAISGNPTSIVAPNNKEIITWYADLYEDNLNLEEFAAEFDMEADEFKAAVLRISDTSVQQLAMQKILQLEGGATVPRFELEQQYPHLQKAFSGLDPLTTEHIAAFQKLNGITAAKKAEVKAVHAEKPYEAGPVKKAVATKEAVKALIPQYQQKDYVEGDKLTLSLKVSHTDVKVGEKLSFTVTSNHNCEMQILYIESSGNVEIFPSQLIGDPWLYAGQPKRIPLSDAGHIEFDEPGHDETLLIYCSQKGLAEDKLTIEAAKELAKSSNKPATRGISFKLAKKVEKGKGKSAFHAVSFNVTH